MKSYLLVAAVVLTGCSTPEERERNALMDQIEEAAKLPPDAGDLKDYARFYSFQDRDQVIGTYALPSVIKRLAGEQCSQMMDTQGTMRDVPCLPPNVVRTKAGERLWVDKSGDMPFDAVAGCEVITFAYELRTKRLKGLDCVGHRPVSY